MQTHQIATGDICRFIMDGKPTIGRIFKIGTGDRAYVRYVNEKGELFNVKVSMHGLRPANSEERELFTIQARERARAVNQVRQFNAR